MKISSAIFAVFLGLLAASCSKKADADRDEDRNSKSLSEESEKKESESGEVAPEPDEIGEDCVAFLRATSAVLPNQVNKDCPTCPAGVAFEVLKFSDLKIDKISPPNGSTCEVDVRIRAQFNPSNRGAIRGGLVGWIPLEQREQYTRGVTPAEPQTYKVKITYTHTDGFWRAVEFAPGDSK